MLRKSKKEIIVIIVAFVVLNLILFCFEYARAQTNVNNSHIGYDAYTDEQAEENRIKTEKNIIKESLEENFQKDWPIELSANVLVVLTTLWVQKRRKNKYKIYSSTTYKASETIGEINRNE